jgi:hypothetical protein
MNKSSSWLNCWNNAIWQSSFERKKGASNIRQNTQNKFWCPDQWRVRRCGRSRRREHVRAAEEQEETLTSEGEAGKGGSHCGWSTIVAELCLGKMDI